LKLKLSKSPYRHMLDDPQFRLWVENLERGSAITAHEYYRRMGRICRELGVTPKALAGMDEKQAGNFLLAVVSHWEARKSLGTNIKNYTKPLKSWWSFNDVAVRRKVRIQGADDHVKYESERVPTKEELGRILDAADLRAKAAVALMAFAGCRVEVLGSYVGDDGLKLSDLPDAEVKHGTVLFSKAPAMVLVRKALSKSRHRYFTFLPEQGCGYLKQYLEWRMRRGEDLSTGDKPVITAGPFNQPRVGGHISTPKVGALIRKAIRDAGFQWRPYVLRRYFDVRMMLAENEGEMLRDWRSFHMGHEGTIEATYTVNKGLPEDVVEKMRETFAKASEKFLVTARSENTSEERMIETFNRQFLKMAGWTDDEIAKLGELGKIPNEKLAELIDRKQMERLGLRNGSAQKVVPMGEVEGYIAQGWEYVKDMGGSKAIIRLPVASGARV
jgi:integrase